MRPPTREIVGPRPLGAARIDGGATAEHLSALGRDWIAEPPWLALIAPVVLGSAAQPIGIGERFGIGIGPKNWASFEQQDGPRWIFAQSARQHAARRSRSDDDGATRQGRPPRASGSHRDPLRTCSGRNCR